MFLKLLKEKAFIWLLCSIPFWVIAAVPLFSTNFWHWSLVISGYTAASLLAICLSLAPLHKNFPSIRPFNLLNRRKREIGLSVFFYAVFHASSFFMYKFVSEGSLPWIYLLHPVIIPGLVALIILLLLALTSNDISVKKLTYHKWKSFQRMIYIVEACVFLHMLLQPVTVLVWGCLIFIPLFILQRLRLNKRSNL